MKCHSLCFLTMLSACGSAISAVTKDTALTTNADVVITDIGPTTGGRIYTVEVTQLAAGSCAVVLEGNDPDDIIRWIKVNDAVGFSDIVALNISQDGTSQTQIGAIEEIYTTNPSNVKLGISLLYITGDLGAPGSANSIEVAEIENIEIDGDWYADVTIDNLATMSTDPLVSVTVGGDWLDGGLYNNEVGIGPVEVSGSISGSSLDPIEIWSKVSVFSVTADSISEAA